MARRRHRTVPPLLRFRTVVQLAVVVAAGVAGWRFATGQSLVSVETYCPFGGLETAWAFVTRRRFTCATGAANLGLFLALLGLTLLARRSFCAWACPVGALFEWHRKLAGRLRKRRHFTGLVRVPPRLDAALRAVLRPAVLLTLLGATWATGELVFRGYDPYYIVFSAHGHDVRAWSYGILAGLVLLAFVVPMAWCRYLCPLGAAIWPLSAIGRLRIARSAASCSGCGVCDRVCPHGIDVSAVDVVRTGECTLCLECTGVCPQPGALELHWEGLRR
ncbi:4Fe-4S binding protein [bacterium]|nr:4Fe-4S binding protein [bacterium]